MNRTTIMIFSFIAGALIADATHPAGQRFWPDPATDDEIGCADDCLEPEPTDKLTCWPTKRFVRCEVLDEEKMPPAIIDGAAIAEMSK